MDIAWQTGRRPRTGDGSGITSAGKRTIITCLPGPTFAIDTRGEVIAGNRAMENMTGHP